MKKITQQIEKEITLASEEPGISHNVKCGELLLEVKAGLAHGEFKPWVEDNFPASYRTAADCMKLAGNLDALGGRWEKLSIAEGLRILKGAKVQSKGKVQSNGKVHRARYTKHDDDEFQVIIGSRFDLPDNQADAIDRVQDLVKECQKVFKGKLSLNSNYDKFVRLTNEMGEVLRVFEVVEKVQSESISAEQLSEDILPQLIEGYRLTRESNKIEYSRKSVEGQLMRIEKMLQAVLGEGEVKTKLRSIRARKDSHKLQNEISAKYRKLLRST